MTFVLGSKVHVASSTAFTRDGNGEVTLIDQNYIYPYAVKFNNGRLLWYQEDELEPLVQIGNHVRVKAEVESEYAGKDGIVIRGPEYWTLQHAVLFADGQTLGFHDHEIDLIPQPTLTTAEVITKLYNVMVDRFARALESENAMQAHSGDEQVAKAYGQHMDSMHGEAAGVCVGLMQFISIDLSLALKDKAYDEAKEKYGS